MHRSRWMMRAVQVVLAVALGTGAAQAQTIVWKALPLTCSGKLATSGWAAPVTSHIATNVGSGTETEHMLGFKFAGDMDREMQCTAILPPDYDEDATDPPYITILGWATSHTVCPSSCPANKYVRFDVSSRRTAHDVDLNAAWGTEYTRTLTFAGEGTTSKTYKGYRLKVAWNSEVTASADDWNANDFVQIRIKRDVSGSDELSTEFYLPQVLLYYASEY